MRYAIGTLAALAACASPTGGGGADEVPPGGGVDYLLVVDRARGTEEEVAALAAAAPEVVGLLDPSSRVSVTSPNCEFLGGESAGVDPGELGAIVGGSVAAGEEGAGAWLADAVLALPLGSGVEEGFEAAHAALCRGLPEMTEDCRRGPLRDDPEAEASSAGAFRAGASVHVVFVTDEGDASRGLESGATDVQPYLDRFAATGVSVVVSALAPPWDGADRTCLGGAMTWAVERYQAAATLTGGVYGDIADPAAGCAPTDPADFFARVAAAKAQ